MKSYTRQRRTSTGQYLNGLRFCLLFFPPIFFPLCFVCYFVRKIYRIYMTKEWMPQCAYVYFFLCVKRSIFIVSFSIFLRRTLFHAADGESIVTGGKLHHWRFLWWVVKQRKSLEKWTQTLDVKKPATSRQFEGDLSNSLLRSRKMETTCSQMSFLIEKFIHERIFDQFWEIYHPPIQCPVSANVQSCVSSKKSVFHM